MLLKNVSAPTIRQVLATSSMGLLIANLMTTWCYPAVALPQMEKENSTIHFTPEQSSWFATITLMMSIPGSVIGAVLSEWMGPRKLFLVLSPPLCASTMMMAVASCDVIQQAGMAEVLLFICRTVQGSLVAVLVPVTYLYTYEISDHHLRGTLTSLAQAWISWGYFLCYATGCFFSWVTIAWFLPLITIVPGFLGLLFSPESPLWLVRKNRGKEAQGILEKFRCTSREVSDDLVAVRDNLKDNVSCTESLRLFKKKSYVLAIAASVTMSTIRELVGITVIPIYIVYIFDAAGVGLDPKYSSVIIGTASLICNFIATLLIHNFRRRFILFCGNVLAGTASTIIGTFFYLQSCGNDMSVTEWLPLVGLATYTFGYAAAIAPTTWTLAVEVLPGPVRSVGYGMSLTSNSIAAFVISKSFTNVHALIGMHGVFWFFACGAFSYIVVVKFFIPETYGMSLKDIEDYWEISCGSRKKKSVYETT